MGIFDHLSSEKQFLFLFNFVFHFIIFNLFQECRPCLLFAILLSLHLTGGSVTVLDGVCVGASWDVLTEFMQRSEQVYVHILASGWTSGAILGSWSSWRRWQASVAAVALDGCLVPVQIMNSKHLSGCQRLLFETVRHRGTIWCKHVINFVLKLLFLSIIHLLFPEVTIIPFGLISLLFLHPLHNFVMLNLIIKFLFLSVHILL